MGHKTRNGLIRRMALEKLTGAVGVVERRINPRTKTEIRVYNNKAQGFDTDDGAFSVVCEEHSSLVNGTRHAMTAMMRWPEGFCEDCRTALEAKKKSSV